MSGSHDHHTGNPRKSPAVCCGGNESEHSTQETVRDPVCGMRVSPDSVHREMHEGKRTTTTDSSTKFIGAARVNSVVTGECVALHRGRTTMVWQTSIRNADGKLCAVVTQTQLVLD